MSYVDEESGERCPVGAKRPVTKQDWRDKRAAVDRVLDDLGGIVTRVGDETVGEMWSLYDGQEVLNEIDPAFSEHIRAHVRRAELADPFHVSANTDPKGDRSRRPQDQDPDVLLHVAGETLERDHRAGGQVRDRRRLREPGVRQADDRRLGRHQAVGLRGRVHRRHGARPGIRHICRSSFASRDAADYPLSTRFDEIDTMIVFDDVEIPWENVLFYRHTAAAAFIRATLHRYSMFPFVQRHLRFADLLVGVAYMNAVQTGIKMHQAVREKLAELVCYREGINAHLTAAVEMAEVSPGGLLMPNQALLYTGRVLACTQLPAMMHLARDLCGGQLCVLPSAATFADPEAGPWLDKYLAVGSVGAEDRRRLFAFARDLLNSDYAGHRLTFQLFAQSPAFAHLLAVYNNYDFDGPADLVRRYAGLEQPVTAAAALMSDLNVVGAACVACVRDRGARAAGRRAGRTRPRARRRGGDPGRADRGGGPRRRSCASTAMIGVPVVDASGMTVLPGSDRVPFASAVRRRATRSSTPSGWPGRRWPRSRRRAGGSGPAWWPRGRRRRSELLEGLRSAYGRILAGGVTTLEVKSGYGLTLSEELRQLELLERSRGLDADGAGDHVPRRARRAGRHGRRRVRIGGARDAGCGRGARGCARFTTSPASAACSRPAQALGLFERSRSLGVPTRCHADAWAGSEGWQTAVGGRRDLGRAPDLHAGR